MKLACNYYEETLELIRSGEIALDYVKIPALGFQYEPCEKGGLPLLLAELERIREQTPILLHGFGPQSYNLGARDFIERFDRSVAEQVILASGTRELSGHLGPDMKKAGEYREWKEARQTCVENIRFIRETFPRMPHVAVENMDGNPYAVWSQLGCFLEPDFIREVVEESGAEFLFDVSHAYGAALNLKMDFREYVSRLPMDRLYEIHMNGWRQSETDLMSHLAFTEEQLYLLEEILARYGRPEILTIEYGRLDDRMGIGIPLMGPAGGNERAKEEIRRQAAMIRDRLGEG